MRVLNNSKVIADVGKFLQYQSLCGFCLPYIEGADYIEETLSDEVVVKDGYALIGGRFWWSLEDTKGKVIRTMFSNDEQIAIILNKDNDEDDRAMFDLMQGWRQFISDKMKKAKELIKQAAEK